MALFLFNFPSLTYSEVAITQDNDLTTFWYNSSNTHVATFIFDLCDITPCPGSARQCLWRRNQDPVAYICVTDITSYYYSYWGSVGWNTGRDWGYRPESALKRVDKGGKSLISRMTLSYLNKPVSICDGDT